ncbi:DUF4376 domain-containing protein [Thalassobius sp. S69A]|uniref:DUF4376 domain-containing protein n=1 Tax=unclassified Thalassovita TaxID=2619711 RepID=UPI000C1109C9|nr:hypothetical protein [Paracoccaceae bacterium]MBA86355.1 hypothetical protein [Paracoccaceae bacterium]MBT26896.1 hypothetical protein [Paracoccaceae bacterium]|tara:strand:- start:1790 stop:2203 length:414 start_codon:yes stop_codon:yes gene_type:complete
MSQIDLSALITATQKQESNRLSARDALAQLRWQHETAGLILADGQHIATTRESQSQIANAAMGVQAGLITDPMPWKTLQGWTEFSPVSLLDMATQVSAHVRACFAAERAISAQLEISEDPAALDLQAAFAQALAAGS